MSVKNLSVTYRNIESAADRLRNIAHRTPVMSSRQMNEKTGGQIFFKCENFQRAGAFKFRGAYNAISCLDEKKKKKGVVAYSSGNHAQAMALAGKLLGVSVTIVMPTDAPALKSAATRDYGAIVIPYDRQHEDREIMHRLWL